MKHRYRISGRDRNTGRRLYMTYACHKNEIFYSFNREPSNFKTVEGNRFMELQLMAQTKLINVQWECESETLQRRTNISSRSANRAVQRNHRRTSI